MSTNIEWTDETWNIIVGCSRISPGCEKCYAATAAQSARLQQFPQYQKVAAWDGTVEFVENQLLKPLSWKKPKRIFVCSMSDLFHENVPFEWIDKVMAVIALSGQHTFQVLTKRPHRAKEYFSQTNLQNRWYQAASYNLWQAIEKDFGGLINLQTYFIERPYPLPNLWLGVTVENQAKANERIPILLQVPAVVRFLSCEPLLEAIDLSEWLICPECQGEQLWYEKRTGPRSGISGRKQCPKCKDNRFYSNLHWAIIGSESGNDARPSRIENIETVVTQFLDAKLPVFVKQLGQFPVTNSPEKFPKTELITRQKYSDWCFEQATKLGFDLEGMHFVKLSDKKGGDIAEFPPHLQLRQFPVSLLSAIAPGQV